MEKAAGVKLSVKKALEPLADVQTVLSQTRMDRVKLAGIIALGFGLRLWFLRVHQVIERDGVEYASIAEGLARFGRLIYPWDLRSIHPPGYPALVAPVYLVVGDSHRAGQIVSLAAGVALIALVYLLGRRLAGGTVALIAAALTAIYPPLVHWSVSVHTETTYAMLLCVFLLNGLRLVDRPSIGGSALAGALVGTMYLVRQEGLLVAAGFAWAAGTWVARVERATKVAARAAGFAAALLLFLVPYMIHLHDVKGTWTPTGKGLDWRIAQSPEDFETIAYGPDPGPKPSRGLRGEAVAFAERYLRNLFGFEGQITEAVSLLGIGLAAVGFFAATRWRERFASEGLVLCAFVPLLLYPAFWVNTRWTDPYMAVLFVYCARGIAWVAEQTRGPSRSHAVAVALVVLLAVRYAPQLAIPLRYTPEFDLVEHRAAGLWIRDRFGPNATVMSRAPEIAYYARAHWVRLPHADIADVIEAARRAHVSHLVIDELLTRRHRPQLLPLLADPSPHGLTLLHQSDQFPHRRVRIFSVTVPEVPPLGPR